MNDVPYRLDKEPDGAWVLICHGVGPVRFEDRGQANSTFQIVQRAYGLGRSQAFQELRKLIGVD
jgi:hypothetical protein